MSQPTKGAPPSFQFYPGDQLRNAELRTCSLAARGLWSDMICFMHQGSPYGHLTVGKTNVGPAQIARMVGASYEEVVAALTELEVAGVFSRTEQGVIFCRRMVKDHALRQQRAGFGKLGGNPVLIGPSKGEGDLFPDSDLPKRANEVVCPHKEIISLFHAMCPSLPTVGSYTPSLREKTRRFWQSLFNEQITTSEQAIERIRALFAKVESSDFLSGRSGAGDFSYTWIIAPKNMAKILSGKYDPSRPASSRSRATSKLFQAFVDAYPAHRRSAIPDASETWAAKGLDSQSAKVMTGLSAWTHSAEWQKDDGRWVPSIKRFLEEDRWNVAPRAGDSFGIRGMPAGVDILAGADVG